MKQLPDFDLSIIMLLNKPLNEYAPLSTSMLKYYERNGIEVVIVISGATEQAEIIDYVVSYPFISWKVVVCNEQISTKAFNIGIRQATKQYLFIMNEEQEFLTDVIYELREKLESYSEHYAVGQSLEIDIQEELDEQTSKKYLDKLTPNGSIMAKKEYFERIGGFYEGNSEWSIEYEHLRTRLELAGIHRLFFPNSVLVRRTDCFSTTLSYHEERKRIPQYMLSAMSLPSEMNANGENWGNNCSTVLYNWKEHPYAKRQCMNYLSQLKQFDITSDEVFDKSYPLIALIPTYNESERIIDCLRSVEKHCDGIILLDDDSTDDTYRKVQSEKLLIKAKKQRKEFNDKQNRNILLDIVSFFKAEWIIFIDADERFDDRFTNLREVMEKPKIDTVGIWIANLWNSADTYRVDIEDMNPYSKNGLWFRWRMFRNKGRMQILTNRTLHFSTVPYMKEGKNWISKSLLVHLGYLDYNKRINKYNFYKVEDRDKILNYNGILNNEYKLSKIQNIALADLKI